MKKKLALLMAAIMTVAMVPVTALAAVDVTVAKKVKTGIGDDYVFDALIEFENKNKIYDKEDETDQDKEVQIEVSLKNGKFAKGDNVIPYDEYQWDTDAFKPMKDGAEVTATTGGGEGKYLMNDYRFLKNDDNVKGNGYADVIPNKQDNAGIIKIDVRNDRYAIITLNQFDRSEIVAIPIRAYAEAAGDVIATVTSNDRVDFDVEKVIAVANDNEVQIESEGITTFVEDSSAKVKAIKPITISGMYNTAINTKDHEITLKLKGNYKFNITDPNGGFAKDVKFKDGKTPETEYTLDQAISFLNDSVTVDMNRSEIYEDKIVIKFGATNVKDYHTAKIYIDGIYITPTKACEPVDVAKLTISSKDFDSTTIEVAKMVEEAVTYTVEDDELPVIWAGKDYGRNTDLEDTNTLKVSVEENTGDILNTSRKATFTFPDGIEVVGFKMKGAAQTAPSSTTTYKTPDEVAGKYEIDENVLTIWNYQKKALADESDPDKGKVDFDIEFVLNAKPTFNGDVEVTLGGEFDDVTLKVATVKAPYTVEAKTTEVLIDYRYVPVNEIVITEADDGLLEDKDIITLSVEKMDFEDAGSYEITSGDIEVDVDVIGDEQAFLNITVKDESTEASTIVISGLELYLDRTLPVGGYALYNEGRYYEDPVNARSRATNNSNNILWENSHPTKTQYDKEGIFKYKEYTCNDAYVEVVTQARDQDDYTTNRKIVLTIGAATMAVGTETITLDTPAYINSENYTQLPLRAVSEAFGATVNWDDASRTVTIMMGQRVVSMTIGSKTMYVNGTPVAMNTAPEITNSRTFVPVRDLANALGITKIDWNEASATVTLN